MKQSAVRILRRYAPFVAAAVLVFAAIAVFGGDGDPNETEPDRSSFDREELIRSGPMSTEKAQLEGRDDINFGAGCDPGTGRIKLPSVYAPPCVEPFEGDNGGDTATGVTEDTIKIVAYVTDPDKDPLVAAFVSGLGADLDIDAAKQTLQDYVALYNKLYETYGRQIEIEFYTGTGDFRDTAAARADAIAIADMEPFAVIGGPLQASATFADELAARGVICAQGCGLGLTDSFIAERFPLAWTVGPTADQASMLTADAIGNLAGPGKAEMAGSSEMRDRERVYGAVHYDTPDGEQQEPFEALVAGLEGFDIELETEGEFFFDPNRLQEIARPIIAQLKDAGVTTVIYSGDPVTPTALTAEATAQNYYPEWILGPNALADTVIFARSYDADQWSNGFGLALATNPGTEEISNAYQIYDWAYGRRPPSNIYQVLEPPLESIFGAIHLAGPELTQETFRDGMFRLPPSGEGPTRPTVSYGDSRFWSEIDYGSLDDAAIVWWDPETEGPDEIGQEAQGMYRYANGGQRYSIGEFPTSPADAGLFDNPSSAVELTEPPDVDSAPHHPPPEL